LLRKSKIYKDHLEIFLGRGESSGYEFPRKAFYDGSLKDDSARSHHYASVVSTDYRNVRR
jgi:hypothetical protein